MYKIFAFLFVLFFVTGTSAVFAQNPQWDFIPYKIGYPDILVDGDYIWYTRSSAIVQLDTNGNTIKTWTTLDPGIISTGFNAVEKSSNGNITVRSTVLEFYDGIQWTPNSFPPSVATYPWKESIDSWGDSLIMIYKNRFKILHGNSFFDWAAPGLDSASSIEKFSSEPNGPGLWANLSGSVDDTLYYFNGNSGFLFPHASIGLADKINYIEALDSGQVVLVGIDTVFIFNGTTLQRFAQPQLPFQPIYVKDVESDGDSIIRFAVPSSAVFEFDFNSWTTRPAGYFGLIASPYVIKYRNNEWMAWTPSEEAAWTRQGTWKSVSLNLPDFKPKFNCTVADDSILWLTADGLYRYDRQSWTHYNSQVILGSSNAEFFDITTGVNGDLWMRVVDYTSGLFQEVVQFDGATFTVWDSANGIEPAYYADIAADSTGNIWLAKFYFGSGASGGIYRFNGNSWFLYDQSNSPFSANASCFGVSVDPLNNIWTHDQNQILKFDQNTWTSYSLSLGGFTSSISDVYCDSQGNVWFSSQSEIVRYDGLTWTRYSYNNSSIPYLQSGNYRNLYAPDSANVYVGAGAWPGGRQDSSLVNYQGNNNWNVFDITNAPLGGEGIFYISGDKFGHVYLHTLVGLFIYNPNGVWLEVEEREVPRQPSLAVYPNPANGRVTVSATGNFEKLQLLDMQGRILLAQDWCGESCEIDISSLPGGIYIVALEGEGTRIAQKLVVE